MSAYTPQRLFQLLPTVYRLRDADHGRALEALVAVVGEQVALLEDDIAQLYDNWFVETCEDWAVPYIGDLLGVRGVHSVHQARFTQRARVANTLQYRRRKGTASMLEQLARDVTGWPARAVEFFELLATTQHMNHLRPRNVRTWSLRESAALETVGSPFDPTARTADVRSIARERGRYNIPNVGLFLWRLGAYPALRVQAFHHGQGHYSFSPLGHDAPLFNNPQTEADITHVAQEINVPGTLRRRVLYNELEARRVALVNGTAPPPPVYFGAQPVLRVYLPGDTAPVAPEEIAVCNLENWRSPPDTRDYKKPDDTPVSVTIRLSIDPQLGRLRLKAPAAAPVLLDFYYGSVAELGGGAYERTLRAPEHRTVYSVRRGAAAPLQPGIAQALVAWVGDGQPDAIIQIEDSLTYDEQLDVTLPAGRTLEIRASNGCRPLVTLQGVFTITAAPATGNDVRASLLLDGLILAGHGIEVQQGDLGLLSVNHCTLVPGLALNVDGTPTTPGAASVTIAAGNRNLEALIARSIVGGLDLGKAARTDVRDSIVDGTGDQALSAETAVLKGCTLFGPVEVEVMELAENCIFTDDATAKRRQQGCVRFSYVGEAAQLPRLYRCQPQWAARQAVEAALLVDPHLGAIKKSQIRAQVAARVKPLFTETAYGRAAYGQLHRLCADEIAQGADDESEMGVLHFLQQPQREVNLRASLDEYLRAGLEAGIFFVT